MKNTIKLLSLGLFLFGITTSRAQISTTTGGADNVLPNVPTTNTNVGIGTTTPYTKLEVVGTISSGLGPSANNLGMEFGGLLEPSALPLQIRGVIGALNSGTGVLAGSIGYQPRTGVNASHIFFNERIETFRITASGNVGIGTPLPIVKLDLGGTTDQDIGVKTALSNYAFYGAWQDEAIIAVNRRPSNGTFTQTTKGAASINLNSNTSGSYIKFTTNNIVNTLGVERMRIIENGNVGIGTTNPDEKLTVKGKIHAEEIKVDLAVPADYVFQKYYTGKSQLKADYVMPTLAEIENFTKKNHHLPNVPSAKEIQEKGVSLGEMSNVLLQKVEELTLYTIEQNNKLMLQQEELERLKKENENSKLLTERLSAIENILKNNPK